MTGRSLMKSSPLSACNRTLESLTLVQAQATSLCGWQKRVPTGIVYAIDIEPDMLRYINERAAADALHNIKTYLVDYEHIALPEPVDLILIINTYHHIPDRISCFAALRRHLLPGGKLVVIDFTEESPMGPPPEHRMNSEFITTELTAAGYIKTSESSLLPHQSLLIFEPSGTP